MYSTVFFPVNRFLSSCYTMTLDSTVGKKGNIVAIRVDILENKISSSFLEDIKTQALFLYLVSHYNYLPTQLVLITKKEVLHLLLLFVMCILSKKTFKLQGYDTSFLRDKITKMKYYKIYMLFSIKLFNSFR